MEQSSSAPTGGFWTVTRQATATLQSRTQRYPSGHPLSYSLWPWLPLPNPQIPSMFLTRTALRQVVWSLPASVVDTVDAEAALGEEHVYLASLNREVFAVDLRTGDVVWRTALDGSVFASVTLGNNGFVFVASFDKHLYALNSATGEVAWTFKTQSPFDDGVSVHPGGFVLAGTADESLHALDWNTGEEIWSIAVQGVVRSRVAVNDADGTVYCGTARGVLYAIEADGELRWQRQLAKGAALTGSVAIGADGTVYQGAADGRLYSIDLAGQVAWAADVGGESTSPVVSSSGTM